MKGFLRIGALVLVALGIAYLIWGLDLSDTFANRFMKEMAGEYPNKTENYIFGGVVMIAIGVGLLIFSFWKREE